MDSETSQHRVLIVDNPKFSTLIAKMLPSDQYWTATVDDCLKAIGQLRDARPDLLLIEESLGGNGLRLAEIVALNPAYSNTKTILMSVKPTPDGILRARNAGVDVYMAKPFRPSELRARIDSLFSQRDRESAQPESATPPSSPEPQDEGAREEAGGEIRDRIKKIEGLPPFPATHAEILKLAKSDEASSEKIAEQLKMDPSLLALVFKLVNSSAYGFQKKVDNLKLAVTLLGLEEVANVVMTAQIFQKLSDYDGGAGLDLQGFWKHSVGTAFVAKAVSRKLQVEQESAFLAGMLHDLGKIVLDRCFAEFYRAVLDHAGESGVSLFEAEKLILGLTHTDVGGQLATEWKFADNFLNCILYHHAPGESRRYARLTGLVHLADVICRQLEYGSGGDDTIPDVDESVVDRFSLGERGMEILTEASKEELLDADSFLSALSG